MWKLLQESPATYIIKLNNEKGYEIFITDFVCLWHVYFTEKSFLLQLKESNQGIEFEDDFPLLDNGNKILAHPEKLKKVNVSIEDGKNTLSVFLMMSCGFPFKFKCKLAKASNEMMFETVTQQLLKIINDLWTSEITLRNIVLQKDKELAAYKEKYGEILHKHKKTKPFCEEVHMNKHNMYNTNFGESAIPASILQKVVEIPEKNIKMESSDSNDTDVKIKQEIMTPTTEQEIPTINNVVKQECMKKETQLIPVSVKRRKKGLNF